MYYDIINCSTLLDGGCGSDSAGLGHLGISWQWDQSAYIGDVLADALSSNGFVEVPGISYERPILYRGVLWMGDSDLILLYALEVLGEGLDWA